MAAPGWRLCRGLGFRRDRFVPGRVGSFCREQEDRAWRCACHQCPPQASAFPELLSQQVFLTPLAGEASAQLLDLKWSK